MKCLSGGKVALIYYGLVAMTFTVRHPLFSIKKMSQYWPVLKISKFAFNSTDSMKNLQKTWDLTVLWLECLLVAIWMTWTLEPIKSLCTISTLWLVFFGLMVSLSHLQRLCHSIYGRVLEYDTLWTGSLWHFGRRFSRKAFAFWMYREMGFPPRT